MKTSRIFDVLRIYGILELKEIYRLVNAYTDEEKHTVRGILSTLKSQGKVRNIDRGIWAIVI